jgi:hypothetical protein
MSSSRKKQSDEVDSWHNLNSANVSTAMSTYLFLLQLLVSGSQSVDSDGIDRSYPIIA